TGPSLLPTSAGRTRGSAGTPRRRPGGPVTAGSGRQGAPIPGAGRPAPSRASRPRRPQAPAACPTARPPRSRCTRRPAGGPPPGPGRRPAPPPRSWPDLPLPDGPDQPQLPLHRARRVADPRGDLLDTITLHAGHGDGLQLLVAQKAQQPAVLLGHLGRQ